MEEGTIAGIKRVGVAIEQEFFKSELIVNFKLTV